MDRRVGVVLAGLLAGQGVAAHAQQVAAEPAQVVVTGTQSDTAARRDFVAGKIIIGRKRIEDAGVRTVEELLKREPAITVGGDGSIGLLNLPGYTQILVDGQPPAPSQAPALLELARVERIEIVKTSMAEFGPFGIAGTINIVTRQHARSTATELSTGLRSIAGRLNSSATLTHHQSSAGAPLRLGATLSFNHTAAPDSRRVRQRLGAPGQDGLEQASATIESLETGDSVAAGASLTWQRSGGATLSFSPDLYASRSGTARQETRRWRDGALLDASDDERGTLDMLFLPVRWQFKPTSNSRAELRFHTNLLRLDTRQLRHDRQSDAAPTLREARQQRDGRVHTLDLSYKTSLGGGHSLSSGADLFWSRQDSRYARNIDGMPDHSLAALGDARQALSTRLKLHVQDEWRVNERLALSAGVAGAARRLAVREGVYAGTSRYQLWSPSVHASHKIGADDKRQFRLSLARSYKAPDDDSITLRPQIDALAPCPASGLCGPNTVDTYDSAGNVALRPEQALGLNLAYEHGLGDDSQITVEWFTRRIDGKFGTAIGLEAVPWSQAQRYVARPVNLGQARSSGIDIEAELALAELAAGAPPVRLRASVGWARSRVDSVPGPDNRIDRQTPWSAKLGGSYQWPGMPVRIDLDANWSPSVWIRTSASERLSVARRTELDASASWTVAKGERLVMGARAARPSSPLAVHAYLAGGQQVRVDTRAQRYATLYLRLESTL